MMFLLAACGTGQKNSNPETVAEQNPLLPFPYGDARDATDQMLFNSIEEVLALKKAPPNSRFEYTRIDLDGDRRKDALVYMKAPYRHWCGKHGCALLVMKAGLESFELISEVTPIRPPLIVSENRSNGWRDVIVRVDGRWWKTKDVALNFDGESYPHNPALQPAINKYAALDGIEVFPR
jgi:hypothetical protein